MKTEIDPNASEQKPSALTEQELSSVQGGMIRIDPPLPPRRPPGWLGIDPPPPKPRVRSKWELIMDTIRLQAR